MVRLPEKENQKEHKTGNPNTHADRRLQKHSYLRQTTWKAQKQSNQANGNGDAEMDDGISCSGVCTPSQTFLENIFKIAIIRHKNLAHWLFSKT